MIVLASLHVLLVLAFVAMWIASRRGEKNAATDQTVFPRRVMSAFFLPSFFSSVGAIVLLVIGIVLYPWYIRLLSVITYTILSAMLLIDAVVFGLLYHRLKEQKRTIFAFGGFSLVHGVFCIVALCAEQELFVAAAGDIITFIGIVAGGLGRFVSIALLWKYLFLGAPSKQSVSTEEQ